MMTRIFTTAVVLLLLASSCSPAQDADKEIIFEPNEYIGYETFPIATPNKPTTLKELEFAAETIATSLFEDESGVKDRSAFVMAMLLGDLDKMEAMAEAGFEFDQKGIGDCTLFYFYTARFVNPNYVDMRVIKKMLELGADPLAVCRAEQSMTPLSFHVAYGSPKSLRVFLDHGIDPNTFHPAFNEPLIFSTTLAKNIPNLKLLIEYGADVNIVSKRKSFAGYHSLFTDVLNLRQFELTYILLVNGADPYHKPSPNFNIP